MYDNIYASSQLGSYYIYSFAYKLNVEVLRVEQNIVWSDKWNCSKRIVKGRVTKNI